MSTDRELISTLINQLEQGLSESTLTPVQEEKLREEIGNLQMNLLIGNLLLD
jgi:hypothetical protein